MRTWGEGPGAELGETLWRTKGRSYANMLEYGGGKVERNRAGDHNDMDSERDPPRHLDMNSL